MKRKLMLLLTCLFIGIGLVTAQNQKVTGVVLSEDDGQPVVGASILVKGTKIGTSTDMDGKFTLLNIPSSAKVLAVSYIGMKTSEVAIKANLKIVLKPDAQVVDEVVVVAYGTAKKSSFTGSAKSVSSDQIVSGNRESIDKAIAGKISGVRVSSSTGDPGAAGEVNIRGVGSISASTTPLYVIDGVPIQVNKDMSFGEKSSSTLSTLNPEDVESMTILKDAAAASLYGSRAANGVVIITTKKGKSGATKVTYSGEVGFSSMAVKQFEMATGPQYIQYVTDGALNDYILNKDAYIKNDYPNMAGATDQQWKDYAKTKLVPGDVASLATDPTGKTSTDWRKEIYRTSMSQDHQVSLSGGNDKTRFYSGIGYNKADGIVLGSSFDRISGRLNVDHKINKFVDVSLKQMVSVTSQNGFRDQGDQAQGIGTSSPLGILYAMDPTATVKNADGTYNAAAGMGKVSNPHIMLAGESSAREFVNSKTKRSLSNGDLSVKILPELVFKTVFGYDYTSVQHQEYWSPTSVNGISLQGLGQRDNYENQIVTSSSTLRYSKSFNKVHNLDALVAFESESSKILWLSASAKGYTTDKLPELSAGQTYKNGSAIYDASMLSYLGNVNYNYNSKYYVSGSFRRDGSSRLGSDNRWGDFWSASVAWRLSQEDFLKDNPLFSDLKLRASYGTNGTLPSDYYASQRLYSYDGGYGTDGAIYWSNPGNIDLGWEKSKNFNVGFDWNIYNRVNLTLEYYNKVTTDLLFQVPSSVVTGFSKTWQNLGKMTNDGIELEVSSVNIKNKNFSWNTSLNFTSQKNKINELPAGKDISFGDGGMYILKEGESIHSFYLPTWMGVNKETGLGEFLIDPKGDKIAAANRTNYYSQAGKSVVGKAMPDVLGGLTNTFSYKGFDLSFLITYQFGGNLFDYPGYFAQSDGVRIGSFNTTKDYAENYWREPGDDAKYPKPIAGNPYRSDKWSSRHVLSTDHIRLKDITFGYTVPKFNKNISRLRVYFKANNLALLWVKTKGIEPEVALNGYRQVDTPATRNCAVGVNLEF